MSAKKKNIKTGNEASANREVVDQFPTAIKKIIEEKGFLPDQEFCSGKKKKSHKRHLLLRKRNEHQDLR